MTNKLTNISGGNIQHFNFYTYLHWKFFSNLIITTGFTGDLFKQERISLKKNEFNPKFGLIWDITPDTSIRTAAFRVLKRPLVANQTIEPTQVAGFNQFFDDVNGTLSWRYGAAIDHKVGRNIFAGLEASWRDLKVPGPLDSNDQWNESLFRTYIFWAFGQSFSIGTKYEFETFDRTDSLLNNGFKNLETHKVPISISYNHPSGLGFNAKATYINQKGIFEGAAKFVKGSEKLTTVDLSLSYRLPNRLGLISFAVQNIFNNESQIQQNFDSIKPTRPEFEPERQFFIRANFAL